jgi:hypothetical protein
MKVSTILASNWLKKDDLNDPVGGEVFTIAKVTEELVGQDQQPKWALHWKERSVLPMLLNKTNLRLLASMFGDDTDDWRGKEVEVYHDPSISYNGQLVGGLRVRPPRPVQPRARPTQPRPAPRQDLPDDDVGF